MKIVLAIVVSMMLLVSFAYANQTGQQKVSAKADAKSQGEVKPGSSEVTLDSGSQIQAEMNSTLDLKKARPGDKFKMKTSRPVKRDNKEVISKGSTITGHVEQVTRAEGNTQATLIFDQIEDKKTGAVAPLQAMVKAIASARQQSSAMTDEPVPSRPSSGSSTARQQSSGGLVGGAVGAVGGVTGTVTSTVDSTTRGTVGADAGVGRTAGNMARGTIQIVSDTTANVTSGSTLAFPDRNPKIESGTRFILETTSTLTLTKQKKEEKGKN